MPLPKLKLTTDRDGYTFKYGPASLAIQLEGGGSRFRTDLDGMATSIDIQWKTDPAGYDYLMAFYRTTTKNGALPFLIDLILHTKTVSEYTAHFVPGTLGLVSQAGLSYIVSATLEVVGNVPDATTDQAIIDAF
jgi:hypothetical protein